MVFTSWSKFADAVAYTSFNQSSIGAMSHTTGQPPQSYDMFVPRKGMPAKELGFKDADGSTRTCHNMATGAGVTARGYLQVARPRQLCYFTFGEH